MTALLMDVQTPLFRDDTRRYSSVEVCQLADVTYRQLDYWIRTGVLTPTREARGSGTQRGFNAAALRDVILVAACRRNGMALDDVRALIATAKHLDHAHAIVVVGGEAVPAETVEDITDLVALAGGAAVVIVPPEPVEETS